MNEPSPASLRRELFDAAAVGDVAGACDLVAAQAAETGVEKLLETLAAVQVEVGERWAANEFTIADEHRATAVVDAALAVVERLISSEGRRPGNVSLVCAETEWHTLPARLAAAWLRVGGWEVDFLGGSLPSSVLVEDLRRRRPDLVAVSCSVPDQLFGARRTIAAAASVGLPVLAGGAAFGSTDRRARVLGASGWAAGAAAIADAAVAARDSVAPRPVDPRLELSALEVISHQERLLARAVDALRRRFPRFLVPGAAAEAQTIEDVRSIIRFAAAAVLVADDRVFEDFIGWLVAILEVRGVPVSSLDAALEALLDADPPVAVEPVLEVGRRRIASGG